MHLNSNEQQINSLFLSTTVFSASKLYYNALFVELWNINMHGMMLKINDLIYDEVSPIGKDTGIKLRLGRVRQLSAHI